MDQDVVISLTNAAMQLALKVALPLMLAGLAVGLIVSLFQAITQIQEQTLSFIPKIMVTFAVLVIGGPWMLGQLTGYAIELWSSIPSVIG
ncbi:MAG: fliQ [Solirubrobacterales bacterium]|jgi:flagellar biosynthetic protein FliQ|nr:fliQ [Solirubrobacterales bacterium]